MARVSSEVVVVGGGPAGCAAATLLARWGHRVALVHKPDRPAHDLGESIPPSARKLFDVLGVRTAMDAAAFIRSTGNTVWWGSDRPRVEAFADGGLGWQVTSERLSTVLREQARRSGVDVRGERLHLADASLHSAQFVLDCTGRAGLLARARGLRIHDSRFRTVAMVGVWRSHRPFDLPNPSHTLIESYDGGWAWSVPRSAQERFVAVMVDPRTSRMPSVGAPGLTPGPAEDQMKPGPAGYQMGPVPAQHQLTSGPPDPLTSHAGAMYREQLERAKHMRRLIGSATLVDGPTGWGASMYHATRYVDDNVLLVGDAASFLDPLSSAGITKALASGWLAAVAVHTALATPSMRETALGFFASREAEMYSSFRALTERFFGEAAAGHSHPFWRDRAEPPVPASDRAAYEQAYEQLRRAPAFRVARAVGLRVEPRPAVCDSQIVMEARLVTGDGDAGVRHAFDVDLLALLDLAPVYTSVPELFAAYNQRHAPAELPNFLAALATALARKWLVWL